MDSQSLPTSPQLLVDLSTGVIVKLGTNYTAGEVIVKEIEAAVCENFSRMGKDDRIKERWEPVESGRSS